MCRENRDKARRNCKCGAETKISTKCEGGEENQTTRKAQSIQRPEEPALEKKDKKIQEKKNPRGIRRKRTNNWDEGHD